MRGGRKRPAPSLAMGRILATALLLLAGLAAVGSGTAEATRALSVHSPRPETGRSDGARGPRAASSKQTFAITPSVRAEVSLDKAFGLCLQDAETGEDIVCTTTSSAVETGEWVGINLQKYIYEGYSLRIGKVLWRSKSMGVQKDSMSYTSSSDDVGSTGEARGGTLTFDILLSKSYFEDGAPARPSSWNATTAAAAAAASFWPWPSHVEFARVSISRASPAYESAVVLRVASRAGAGSR